MWREEHLPRRARPPGGRQLPGLGAHPGAAPHGQRRRAPRRGGVRGRRGHADPPPRGGPRLPAPAPPRGRPAGPAARHRRGRPAGDDRAPGAHPARCGTPPRGRGPRGLRPDARAPAARERPTPSPTAQAQVVCHVGNSHTNVVVSVNRQCEFVRLVPFAGSQLTAAIARGTDLSIVEAEALKVACGLLGEIPEGWSADKVREVRRALAFGARPLVDEVAPLARLLPLAAHRAAHRAHRARRRHVAVRRPGPLPPAGPEHPRAGGRSPAPTSPTAAASGPISRPTPTWPSGSP